MADHLEPPRHVVEHLCHVRHEAAEGAPAGQTGTRIGTVFDRLARQMGG